ncbi:MAG: MarC family protein [Campylobacteraceae bacterium]
MDFAYYVSIFIKFFFLMTPFFVLSVFLSVTKDMPNFDRHALALKVTVSIWVTCGVLLFFGQYIFSIFGITVDAFKIGAGALLFITAVSLVGGSAAKTQFDETPLSLAVVPLAIPVTLGPASVGTLMVIASDAKSLMESVFIYLAVSCAVLCVGAILFLSSRIEKMLGKNGIVVLSKLTGLILAALSAQMIFEGIKSILNL